MPHKFTDENGGLVLVVSSTIPGITFVPAGKTLRDAEEITHTEFEAMRKQHEKASKQNPNTNVPTLKSLTVQLAALQAELEKLKQTL